MPFSFLDFLFFHEQFSATLPSPDHCGRAFENKEISYDRSAGAVVYLHKW
jgi:hypothetical protein